jgi:hypothetical protein
MRLTTAKIQNARPQDCGNLIGSAPGEAARIELKMARAASVLGLDVMIGNIRQATRPLSLDAT